MYDTSQQWRRQGGGTGGTFPQTRKICKGWGTARASASSMPRVQQKIQIFVTVLKILLKFSKTFKFFLKQLSKLSKFLQIVLQLFSQNTVTFLIYSKCLTFSQKYLKINKIFSIFLKIFLNFTKSFLKVSKNFLIFFKTFKFSENF